MSTNADGGHDTDPVIDPGDDTRIMQPAEAGNPLDGTKGDDVPDTDEATDTAYRVHADDDGSSSAAPGDR